VSWRKAAQFGPLLGIYHIFVAAGKAQAYGTAKSVFEIYRAFIPRQFQMFRNDP